MLSLRVAYVFGTAEIIGGGEISLLDLLGEIRCHGVEPVAIVPGPGEVADRLNRMGIEMRTAAAPRIRPWTGVSVWRACVGMKRLLVRIAPDVVHVNGARAMLYAGVAARAARLPSLWHVRVLERDPFLDRIRARLASAIVANSVAAAASLKPFMPGRQEAAVVHNGVDLARIRATPRTDIRKEFGLSDAPILLYAGRLSREKGAEELIGACAVLRERNIPFSCVIVGSALPEDRAYETELRDKTAASGLQDRVVFAGWRDDAVSLMKGADVFVLPSRREAFGRVIVEAWASGLPVIAADADGPRELIEPHADGLLTPTGNSEALAQTLAETLTAPALRAALIDGGQKKAKQFSLSRHAKSIRALYDRLSP